MIPALILSAGYGTRLAPLTHQTPKPLLPCLGKPMLQWTLDQLALAGVKDVWINTHHHPEAFELALRQGLLTFPGKIHFSPEQNILGTGGGMAKVFEQSRADRLLVMNSDALHDVRLQTMIEAHGENPETLATMAVRPRRSDHGYSRIDIDAEGKIHGITFSHLAEKTDPGAYFIGVGIYHQDLFEHLERNTPACLVKDVLKPAMAKGRPIKAHRHPGRWLDLGVWPVYAENQFVLLKEPLDWMAETGLSTVHPTATVDATLELGPDVIVGSGTRLHGHGSLNRCIVQSGADLEIQADARNTVFLASGLKHQWST